MKKELAYRETDGIEVTLLWHTESDSLTVSVLDWRSGETFTLAADARDAMDVFHHPYAHAARRGLELAGTVEPVCA